MKFYTNLLLFILSFYTLNAQILGLDLGISPKKENQIISNELLNPIDTIDLYETEFYSVKLKNDDERQYFVWLRKRVRDVWPYVSTAVKEYNTLNDSISLINKKKYKRQYIRARQKTLADQFEKQLKNLTVSRGQILTKLLHKETGKTTFDIIKELKGGVPAFFYNVAGKAYDINLKQTFDPKKTREDLYIQIILQQDLATGVLKPIYDD